MSDQPANNNNGDIVFSPQEIATLSTQVVAERRERPGLGIRTGIPALDADLLPLRPSELVTVLGRPSNYKTGLMQFVAGHEAQVIAGQGLDSKDYVAYVTWEVAVEEMGMIDLSFATGIDVSLMAQGLIETGDWDKLLAAALQRAVKPLWIIGHSLARRKKRPRLSMVEVAHSLHRIEDETGFHPRLVVLDYLQRIPPAIQGQERRIYVSDNVDRAKDLALEMGCVVMLGCQARREVDLQKVQIPGLADGMETSVIEHASDRMLGVWMPKTTMRGKIVEPWGYFADDHLLIVSIVKQRFGLAGKNYVLWVDAGTNRIEGVADSKSMKQTEKEWNHGERKNNFPPGISQP